MGRFDSILAWFQGEPSPAPDQRAELEYLERLDRLVFRARVGVDQASGRAFASPAIGISDDQATRLSRLSEPLVIG